MIESSSCIHRCPFLKTSRLFCQSYSFISLLMPSASRVTDVMLFAMHRCSRTRAAPPPPPAAGGSVVSLTSTTRAFSSARTLSMWRIFSA